MQPGLLTTVEKMQFSQFPGECRITPSAHLLLGHSVQLSGEDVRQDTTFGLLERE